MIRQLSFWIADRYTWRMSSTSNQAGRNAVVAQWHFQRKSERLKVNDRSDALALMHEVEGCIDVLQRKSG